MKNLTSALLLVFAAINANAQWVKVNEITNIIHDVHFTNSSTGFFTSEQGVIFRTTNSGQSLDIIPTSSISIMSGIHFPSESVGYAVGQCWFPFANCYQGIVYKSIDGGTSWDSIYSSKSQLHKPYFTTNDIGFITGNNYVLKTTNGGATFDTAIVWTHSINIVKLKFTSPSTGFIAANINIGGGMEHAIYKSIDSGHNWQLVYSDTSSDGMRVFDIKGNQGMFVTINGNIHVSNDGGITWEKKQAKLPQHPIDVIITSQFSVYAVTSYVPPSSLHYSSNFGESWTQLPDIQADHAIHKLVFPSPDTSYAISYREIFRNDFITSIKPAENQPKITLYPNPASDFVRIENAPQNSQLKIMDLMGKVVHECRADAEVDVSFLKPGNYLYLLSNSKGSQSGKFIKN